MSRWTYVQGTICINIYGDTSAENRYILETVINHLPPVKGSEYNMGVYIVPLKGYGLSEVTDDEFGNYLYNMRKERNYEKRMLLQHGFMVVLEGALRDTYFEETLKATTKFLCRLAKRVGVEDILVKVTDDLNKSYIFNNTKYFLDLQDDYPNQWTDYLCWQRQSGNEYGQYPQKLVDRYNKEHEKKIRGKK